MRKTLFAPDGILDDAPGRLLVPLCFIASPAIPLAERSLYLPRSRRADNGPKKKEMYTLRRPHLKSHPCLYVYHQPRRPSKPRPRKPLNL